VFDILYFLLPEIKGQALADFIEEFTGYSKPLLSFDPQDPGPSHMSKKFPIWKAFIDGVSNRGDLGAGIVFISPTNKSLNKQFNSSSRPLIMTQSMKQCLERWTSPEQ